MKPCPFCGTRPEYRDHIGYESYIGCVAWGWMQCPTCLNSSGEGEVCRSVHWDNQGIVDQIHTRFPDMELVGTRDHYGKGFLQRNFCQMDPVAKRAISPILRAAVVKLWNHRSV